ncbi:hypothetical protein CPJCM30710_23090 [Clostridium polyendosporum]|uniref:Spore coat protein n=1 Tax=Clostridium polyendosporum TaxID=69208 RepID=A0A919VMJ3_9CLOT|nr:hypothetical protein [Clostridium polyendosporum]GIM29643.1 hypothetical protein CPJCM30710_23090 [Clostridium polyendosporum]
MYSINNYLQEKKINVVRGKEKTKKILPNELDEYNILKQIEVISMFHEKMKNSNGVFLLSIQSSIGKEIEECKVQIKKLKRILGKIEERGPSDSFERELYFLAPKILDRAKKCINYISNDEYISIILRSMKNNEVCLGSCESNNLWVDGEIKVCDISGLCFNTVECDCIAYLNKLKRKGVDISWEKVVTEFICHESLQNISKNFILAMISYPFEFMKICDKRREGKKHWDDNEYARRLTLAVLKDGEALI